MKPAYKQRYPPAVQEDVDPQTDKEEGENQTAMPGETLGDKGMADQQLAGVTPYAYQREKNEEENAKAREAAAGKEGGINAEIVPAVGEGDSRHR